MKRENNLEKHPFVIELLGTPIQRVFLTFFQPKENIVNQLRNYD